MRSPESSKPMKPRSNRWSMLGVNSTPFSPSRRSSFDESRQGLQWLATRFDWGLDSRDTAFRLDLHHTLFEQPLPAPRPDDRLPISVGDGHVRGHPLLEAVLPNIEVVTGLDPATLGDARNLD